MKKRNLYEGDRVVARESVYTQKPLNTDAFKHKRPLRANAFTHTYTFTQILLHTDSFTHSTHLHTDTFTHRRFYTKTLLHTADAFIHRLLYTLML